MMSGLQLALSKSRAQSGVLLGFIAITGLALTLNAYIRSSTRRTLRGAVAATVYRLEGGFGHPAAVINRSTSGAMILALNSAADSPADGPHSPSDFGLMLRTDEGSVSGTWLLYSSQERKIGRGREWFRVPDSFAQWMRQLIRTTPTRHSHVQRFPHGVVGVTEVLHKTPPLGSFAPQKPQYNFVMIDGCNSAGPSGGGIAWNLANAFGIRGSGSDTAYVGWPDDVGADKAGYLWDKRFWENLQAGDMVYVASGKSSLIGDASMVDARGPQF